jgi:tetratricopeptide (TPR) repeat protein
VSEKNAFATREELHLIYEANMNPCMNYWTTDPSYKDTVSMHMQAMRLYDKHEYNLALEAFQRFEPNETEEGYYNLYSGICLLVSNLDNLAINKFKEAIYFSKKYDQIQLSRWYLAMALLKTGNKPEAILTLKKIIEVNAPMRYQAQLIVDRIDTDTNPIKQMFAMVSPKAK